MYMFDNHLVLPLHDLPGKYGCVLWLPTMVFSTCKSIKLSLWYLILLWCFGILWSSFLLHFLSERLVMKHLVQEHVYYFNRRGPFSAHFYFPSKNMSQIFEWLAKALILVYFQSVLTRAQKGKDTQKYWVHVKKNWSLMISISIVKFFG